MGFENITALVLETLEMKPDTRNDDYLLWLEILQVKGFPTGCVSAYCLLSTAKIAKLPSFETVSRARRKLQAEYPNLRASPETQTARAELEEEYKEYARQDV